MRPDCKVLLKAYESLSDIVNKYDADFPEMLAYMYLLIKGYWRINDDGETEEVREPPFTVNALLSVMRQITKKVRNGVTIEEIVSEKELCGDEEEI